MADKGVLFLETTIQGIRIFDEASVREQIQKNLRGKKLCSSWFVLSEFKKTFLGSLITYYNLLVDSLDPHTALRRAWKYSSGITRGVKDRILPIYARLCDEENYDKVSVLERLETWIEDALELEFFEGVEEPLIDNTSCKRVDGEPVKI